MAEDTPIKMPDNRQVLDNLEAYVQDKLSISRSLHDRLGLTENSLLVAQTITVAMVRSNQITTRISKYLPNNIGIGQQNDNDYPDDREDHLYQQMVQQTYIHLPIIPQMKIQSQIIMHAKGREKYMCQQTQVEKN